MDIITLVRAHILKRKGVFFGILLLSTVLACVMSVSLSALMNITASLERSVEAAGIGDLVLTNRGQTIPEEMLDEVRELAEVESVTVFDLVVPADPAATTVAGTESSLPFTYSEYRADEVPYPVFSDDLRSHVDSDGPGRGEAFLPIVATVQFDARIGDTLRIEVGDIERSYRIAAFIEDVEQAASLNIGWKNAYLSEADLDDLRELVETHPADFMPGQKVHIYRSASSGLDDADFARLVESETQARSISQVSFTRDDHVNYASQLTGLFSLIFLLFAGLIFVAMIIVINFNVTTTIQEDSGEIGILKAIGLRGTRIGVVYLTVFLSALIIGFLIGFVLSIPLINLFAPALLDIVSVLLPTEVAYVPVSVALLVLLIIVFLMIVLKLRAIVRISPLRALSGGREDVYFAPLTVPALASGMFDLRLAVRQITSGMRHYLGSLTVISLLLFFTLTVSSMFTALDPDRMMKDFYGFDFDLIVVYTENEETEFDDEGVVIGEDRQRAEDIIESHSAIEDSYILETLYVSYEDDPILLFGAESPDRLESMIEGRAPEHGNEIAVTQILAEELGLTIGDEVTLKGEDSTSTFLVTGLYQSINLAGRTMTVLTDSYDRLIDDPRYLVRYYILEDGDVSKRAAEQLNDEFGGRLEVTDAQSIRESFSVIIDSSTPLTTLLLVISILISFIAISMVFNKVFLIERRDWGIFKAIGMRSSRMRSIFAARFIVIGTLGAALGVILHLLFGDVLMARMIRIVGISSFNSTLPLRDILVPVVVFLVAIAVFSWFVSRRLRTVDVRELVISG